MKKKKKLRPRSIDVVIGGNTHEDEYNISICPLTKKLTHVIEISYLSKKDLQELKSAIDCALDA